MTIEKIVDVGRANGLSATLEVRAARQGVFHHSAQMLTETIRYRAPVPAGLHLSCGLATLTSSEPEYGAINLAGGGLIAMLCSEDRPHFTTEIAPGDARSCGLFVPLSAETKLPQLEEIIHRLETDAPMQASQRVPIDLIVAACTPIDPWFQGDARALVTEARALELTALVWSWLMQREEEVPRPALHRRHAVLAYDIIEANLAHPPTLAELARMVGINVRTLTAAFRAAFSTSIAAHITRRRLEAANSYLRAGESVSSAAYRVGYTPAHFSNAYLRQYGVRPQQIRRTRFPSS